MYKQEINKNKKTTKYEGKSVMDWDEFLPKIEDYILYEKSYSANRLYLIRKSVSIFKQKISLPIRYDEARTLIGEKRREGLKDSYVNSLVDGMLVVVRCGLFHDTDQEDICKQLNSLRKRIQYKPKVDDLLSVEEVKKILNYKNPTKSTIWGRIDKMYDLLFDFLYRTACRQGEARTLKKKHFNFSNHSVTFYDTKTGDDRTVAIPPDMEDRFKDWIKDLRDDDYLFPNYQNRTKPLCEDSVNKTFKKRCARVGIERSVHVHMLRHSCITHLLTSGAPMATVQAIVGHRNFKTTHLYTHILVDNQREAMWKYNPIIKSDDPYLLMRLVRDFIQELRPDPKIFDLAVDNSLRPSQVTFSLQIKH